MMTNIEQPTDQQVYGQLIHQQQEVNKLIDDLREQQRLDQERLDQLICKQQRCKLQISSFLLERKEKKKADRLDKCAYMIKLAVLCNENNLDNDKRHDWNKTMYCNGLTLNVIGHVSDTCYFCNMGDSCNNNCADSRAPLVGARPCYYLTQWGTKESQECKASHGQWILATNEDGLTYRVLLPHMFTLMEPQFQRCYESCITPCYQCAITSGTFQFSASKAAANSTG